MGLRRLIIALFAVACSGLCIPTSTAQDTYDEKHMGVSLRMIGHQVLLSAGDSTSRVLPIIKKRNQYTIPFDSEFSFNPEKLVTAVNRVVKETGIATNYIVEVENCETGEIVYSYEMDSLDQKNLMSCGTRDQPKSCYSLLFTLREKGQLPYAMTAIPLVLMGSVFFFLWRKRSKFIIDPNVISLGKYQFDKLHSTLILDREKTELTSKEAGLLLLLYHAVNTPVEREVILHKIWGDEGDYVGRTLDVFISKLRKKLEADPEVKIVNIRGVGYKLVMGI